MLENFSWFLLVPVWVSVLIMGARFLGISFSKKNTVILSVISTIFSQSSGSKGDDIGTALTSSSKHDLLVL